MKPSHFAERINKELTSAGFPPRTNDRARAFAKLFKISSFQANAILLGQMVPSEKLLRAIAVEFDVKLIEFGLQEAEEV